MARKRPPPTHPPGNPVAKFAVRFNKALVFQDKTRYSRKRKHKSREPFPIVPSPRSDGERLALRRERSEGAKPAGVRESRVEQGFTVGKIQPTALLT